jgi:hypothetical protein
MTAWLEHIYRILSDDVWDGLSFILALLALTLPSLLKRFDHEDKMRLLEYFQWGGVPLLAVFAMLSAYWKRFDLVWVLNSSLILLYLMRQREVNQLVDELKSAIETLKRASAQPSKPRKPTRTIINPSRQDRS